MNGRACSRGANRRRGCAAASNTAGGNNNVVVPESVGVSAIRLPAEVNTLDLGLVVAPHPLRAVGVVGVGSYVQTADGVAVQPGLNGAVSTQVILEALELAGRERGRSSNALGRKIGEGGVIRFTVVHENVALATNTKVLVGA